MKTIQEKIAVMQAYVDGKEIETFDGKVWHHVNIPFWNWNDVDYRVKEEPEYVPFSFEDAEFLIGKVVKHKKDKWVEMLTWCSPDEVLNIPYEILLDNYTFIDGSPCGKLKQ